MTNFTTPINKKTKTKMTTKSRARRRAKTSITSARSARKRTANRNAESLKEASDKLVQTGTEEGGRAPPAGKEKASNGMGRERDITTQHRRTVVLAMRRVSPPIYIREIAKRLGVAKTTIMSDIAAIREEAGSFEVSERKAMIWDTEQFYAQIVGEALRWYEAYPTPAGKLGMLQLAKSAYDALTKFRIAVGLIKVVPRPVAISGSDGGTVQLSAAVEETFLRALDDAYSDQSP